MATIKCCFRCKERTIGCHAKCERYIEESKKAGKRFEEHMAEYNLNTALYELDKKRRRKK